MSDLQIRSASRTESKARVGLSGGAGSGKTLSALLMARGLVDDWNDIIVIDSENNSADLYEGFQVAGVTIGDFRVLPLKKPYSVQRYHRAIEMAEEAGAKCIIVDSLSHVWSGAGGALDLKGHLEKTRGFNSWTAWREITPLYEKIIEKILSCKAHIIVTMRSKMEHVQENIDGKQTVKKVGMEPIIRDGFEYEVTVFMELNHDNTAVATKDRTGIFKDTFEVLGIHSGERLKKWLNSAKKPELQVDLAEVTREVLGEDEPEEYAEPAEDNGPENELVCKECGVEVTKGISMLTNRRHGKTLCNDCERVAREAK